MLKNILPIYLLLFSLTIFAQTNNPPAGKLYDSAGIPRIDVEMETADLDFILDRDNRDSDRHFPATFYFKNQGVRDTVANVGIRLRGNTTRNAQKKAFKISFNTFEPQRKYYGVEKLNLNPEKNDPTVMRSRIGWELARQIGLPAARTNHVELYINGDYFGLYLNTEHIDETFVKKRFGNNDGNLYKCLYPADLDYKGSNPTRYKATIYGRRPYALKTNTAADDYSDLANFITVLNNTPTAELPCALEEVFNVDDYLKTIAFDVLMGNWDGALYNKNNFYLYHNTATGKFEYIIYDLDNTLGIDWLSRDWANRNIYDWAKRDEPRPLYQKIMEVTEYRKRYTYYLQQFTRQYFNLRNLDYYVSELPEILFPYIERDEFYPTDSDFVASEYLSSFEEDVEAGQVNYSIVDFVKKRRNTAREQLNMQDITPIISNAKMHQYTGNETFRFTAQIVDDAAISRAEICYYTSNNAAENCAELSQNAANQYAVTLPNPVDAQLFYQVRVTDDVGQISQFPRCDYATAVFYRSAETLAINEFMASNESTIADEFGEFDDWAELYNYGSEPIFLGDKYLSDKPDNPTKWQLPELTLGAGEYLLIWVDEDGPQGELHTNFKLSADGEFIGIFDSNDNDNALIDGLEFGEQTTDISFGRLPNGTGDFQELTPTPGTSNMPVSVNNLSDLEIEIALSPNPVADQLQINLQNPQRLYLTLLVVDGLGRLLHSEDIDRVDIAKTLATQHWSAGLIGVVLKKDGQVIYTDKLLKY